MTMGIYVTIIKFMNVFRYTYDRTTITKQQKSLFYG